MILILVESVKLQIVALANVEDVVGWIDVVVFGVLFHVLLLLQIEVINHFFDAHFAAGVVMGLEQSHDFFGVPLFLSTSPVHN